MLAENQKEKDRAKKELKKKKSPKSKSAAKKKSAAASNIAKKLDFSGEGTGEPVAKKARTSSEVDTLRDRVHELEEAYRLADNKANYLEGELKSMNLRIGDKDKEISNYLALLNMSRTPTTPKV